MSLITKPTIEPITRAEAKRHLNIEHDDDDILIDRLIVAARQHIETITASSIIRQERRLYIDEFDEVFLPFGPVQNISQVQYIDDDGNTQTLSSTTYELSQADDQILLSYDQSWPSSRVQKNAVWIEYWCGYFDNSVSPVVIEEGALEDMKVAMFLLIGDLYMNREINMDIKTYANPAFDMMIGPYRNYIQ